MMLRLGMQWRHVETVDVWAARQQQEVVVLVGELASWGAWSGLEGGDVGLGLTHLVVGGGVVRVVCGVACGVVFGCVLW